MMDLLPSVGTVTQVIVVVAAFSVLIFVHELGHYLAARLVGVRVERFFVGFDIYGLALKKEYKGTVYGIGILPLGGYCALAGQNDDPRKERQTGAPDELQSKSVWARGLVFGGGVLMNFVFGFFILVAAYMYGIPFIPPVLGHLVPGAPAAVHGFQTGDRILKVDGRPVATFEEAAEAIALTGAGGEMEVEFERTDESGQAVVSTIRVKGRGTEGRGNLNSIGAEPLRSRIVDGVVDEPMFADLYAGKIGVGDEILAVNGVDIPENRGEMIRQLLLERPGEDARLTVRRASDGAVREVAVPLETYGEWDIGLRIGVSIVGVMPDGPAALAGLKAGDVVVAYEIEGDAEPRRVTFVSDFQKDMAGAGLKSIELDVARDGRKLVVDVEPKLATRDSALRFETDTLLGLYGEMEGDAGFKVLDVHEDSPLRGRVRPGDFIAGVNGEPLPMGKSLREAVEEASSREIRLFVARRGDDDVIMPPPRRDVPDANLSIRVAPRISSEYRRPMIGVETAAGPVVSVEPGSFADTALGGVKRLSGTRLVALQFSPDLGTTIVRFVFPESSPFGSGLKTFVVETPEPIRSDPALAGLRSRLPVSLKTAEVVTPLPLFPALRAAAVKWCDLAGMVYRVIHKLIVRTLPLDAVGGPVQLFRIIKIADDRGFAYFLYMVALISINLGVCNLLPFPVLDGGHIVFLLIELVMRRPPPPKVKEAAQWVGIACLFTLMLTVTFYDLFHLFQGTG